MGVKMNGIPFLLINRSIVIDNTFTIYQDRTKLVVLYIQPLDNYTASMVYRNKTKMEAQNTEQQKQILSIILPTQSLAPRKPIEVIQFSFESIL